MSVVVRFPPSPTGYCHVGTARMAVLNYAFAKKHGGRIIFRSEDTDRERSKKEYEEDILEQLKWLGLSWDEFFRQSERTAVYRAALEKLIANDTAYLSKEPSKNDPTKIVEVVRLRNPNKVITFTDILRGDISFDTTELKDFVIARTIDDPLYHFTVVVDDAEMGVTHVIRGEDHISNTPRQILIQEALGYTRPQYAHYPLHLSADRSKLSKRTGDVAVRSYREKGYLSQALLNYIAVLGWTPPSGKEILSLDEIVAEFELTDLHKSGAVFDIEKLRWYNRQYLAGLSEGEFREYALPVLQKALTERGLQIDQEKVLTILSVIRERMDVAEDIRDLASTGEFDFYFADPTLDPAKIPDKRSTREEAKRHLEKARAILAAAPDFSDAALKDALWGYATEQGRGAVLWPLRYALTGRDKSPDPFVVASILMKEATLQRIDRALNLL